MSHRERRWKFTICRHLRLLWWDRNCDISNKMVSVNFNSIPSVGMGPLISQPQHIPSVGEDHTTETQLAHNYGLQILQLRYTFNFTIFGNDRLMKSMTLLTPAASRASMRRELNYNARVLQLWLPCRHRPLLMLHVLALPSRNSE